jgi:peptide/nickel transport system permease protein
LTAYILRRLLYVIPIAIGVTMLVFSLVHLAPGDPLNAVVAPDAPQEVVEQLRLAYGFDKPLPVVARARTDRRSRHLRGDRAFSA